MMHTRAHDRLCRALHAVVNVYVPNAGDGLKRLDYRLKAWDVAFAAYLATLGAKKPVILSGDLNCAHQEIDIHNPKASLKKPGFTPVRACGFCARPCTFQACRTALGPHHNIALWHFSWWCPELEQTGCLAHRCVMGE